MAVCGDEIGANIMMLGYAWQKGLIPLGRDAITKAIELNAVAVPFNLSAFDWGRLLAHDPAAVERMAVAENRPRPLAAMSTPEIVEHRMKHLADYQDADLAKRYATRVERFAAAVSGLDADGALVRAVAIGYARVLAYKDEYEVARLYSNPAFREGLAKAFDGDVRLTFNLAPPILPGIDANGRPRKREFGAWMLPVFGILARLKKLRGTAFDPFGRTADRKLERRLIELYEVDLDFAERHLTAQTASRVKALLDLANDIRGFGPVKEKAFETAMARREALRAEIENTGVEPAAVAAE